MPGHNISVELIIVSRYFALNISISRTVPAMENADDLQQRIFTSSDGDESTASSSDKEEIIDTASMSFRSALIEHVTISEL